jgi:ribosomal protein S18 acetylase RimI-like enzyme
VRSAAACFGRVERVGAEDLPEIARLMAAGYIGAPPSTTYDSARSTLRQALASSDDVLLCVRDYSHTPPKAVAMTWLQFCTDPQAGTLAYHQLTLVAEGARSRGLGTALFEEAEAIARTRTDAVFAVVDTDNAGSRRWIGRQDYHLVRIKGTRVLYRKSLAEQPEQEPSEPRAG